MAESWERRSVQTADSAHFGLRDWLGPHSCFPYDDLAKDMEAALKAGLIVRLSDVSGIPMVNGYPGDDSYWYAEGVAYDTAADALSL